MGRQMSRLDEFATLSVLVLAGRVPEQNASVVLGKGPADAFALLIPQCRVPCSLPGHPDCQLDAGGGLEVDVASNDVLLEKVLQEFLLDDAERLLRCSEYLVGFHGSQFGGGWNAGVVVLLQRPAADFQFTVRLLAPMHRCCVGHEYVGLHFCHHRSGALSRASLMAWAASSRQVSS